MPDVLIIGGKGPIGAGLRTYLHRIDPSYRITSVDLPGSVDRSIAGDAQRDFVDFDISEDPQRLLELMVGRTLVIYLARTGGRMKMNRMTDLVFETVLEQQPVPVVIAASSVRACDGAYSVTDGVWSILAERRFDELNPEPERVSSPHSCLSDHRLRVGKSLRRRLVQEAGGRRSRRHRCPLGRYQPRQRSECVREGILRPMVSPAGRGAIRPRLLPLPHLRRLAVRRPLLRHLQQYTQYFNTLLSKTRFENDD